MHGTAPARARFRQRFATVLLPQEPVAVNEANGIGPIDPPVVCHWYSALQDRSVAYSGDEHANVSKHVKTTILFIIIFLQNINTHIQ